MKGCAVPVIILSSHKALQQLSGASCYASWFSWKSVSLQAAAKSKHTRLGSPLFRIALL